MDQKIELKKLELDLKTQKIEIDAEVRKVFYGTGLIAVIAAVFPFAQTYFTEYRETRLEIAKVTSLLEQKKEGLLEQKDTAIDRQTGLNRVFLERVSSEGRSSDLESRIILAEYYFYLSADPDEQKRWKLFLDHLYDKRKLLRDAIVLADVSAALGSSTSEEDKARKRAAADLLRQEANSVEDISANSPKVYIQFAGDITRTSMRLLARDLVSLGWKVQGSDAGGERTSAASGLNQIRYFSKLDAPKAQQLANDLGQFWDEEISTKDFSRAYPNANGQLEIWISN
ncbi:MULTISPECIES: hypothetical protein [Paracoccaceae]|uniref:hypothetical protein n=1 Tax=Paracoccaceae TaxID=31989 RepID=UPI0032998182